MKVEIRADGAHICGYVNVPGKKSKPIATKNHGLVIETIDEGAFQRAIDRAGNILLDVDHGTEAKASTQEGTLILYEDGIGLYADALIDDPVLIQQAKQKKIVGWSFTFKCLKEIIERQRTGFYPLRRVTDMILERISLIINKSPIYEATTWELRNGCSRTQSNKLNEQYRRRFETVKRNGVQLDLDRFRQRLERIKGR